jgi:Arc/MetJ-type ribon-helix-helix transcriptional regulator
MVEEMMNASFRLPSSLVASLDDLARAKEQETPGNRVTRSDVVRAILLSHIKANPLPKKRGAR